MSVTAKLADGRVLEFPDGTDPAFIDRTVKSVMAEGQPKGVSPDFQRQSAISATRGEHPVLSSVADLSTGLSGTLRGATNFLEDLWNRKMDAATKDANALHEATGIGKPVDRVSDESLASLVTGKKEDKPGIGDAIWPKAEGSEGTGLKLTGALLDPVPWMIGGGMAKAFPYVKIGGAGFVPAMKATAKNALTGGTTGMIIGGLSDEGDATSGGVAGAALSAGIPALGVATRTFGNWLGGAAKPLFESGRTQMAREFFADQIPAANRAKVIAALANANEIVPGSPTTAADRIAGATVGSTDKFGSQLVRAQDMLAGQAGEGISDTAKSIAARQEAARAAELARIGQTPKAIEAAINERAAVTGPMRETSLAAANAGDVIPALEAKVAGREASRIDALQQKGQLDTLAAQQAARANPSTPVAGQPKIPPRYSPQAAVAQEAQKASEEVAGLVALRRAEAENAQWQIDYITSHGLKPLKSAPLIEATNRIANTPGWRATELVPKVMADIRTRIAALTDANGVIDARDLDTLRREIGVSIRKHAGETKDFDKKLAAKLEIQMKDKITQAIDDAGGGSYREYLAEYARRSEAIDRMKIGQELQQALTSATGKERPTVLGNTVRRMEDELGTTLTPEQNAAVERVTKELTRNAERDALGSGVNAGNLFEIAEKGKGSFRLPNFLWRPAMVTNWLMGRLGSSANDLIARDVGKMMLTDPQGFATKYLSDVPMNQRQIVTELVKQKLSGTGQYARASLISASQNGQ